MDKKRLEISLDVLNAARSTFLEKHKFIDGTLKEECKKERMSAYKVFFFPSKLFPSEVVKFEDSNKQVE